MTSKIILGGIVVIAFVAGTLATGTVASAQQGGQGNNFIVDAINAFGTEEQKLQWQAGYFNP